MTMGPALAAGLAACACASALCHPPVAVAEPALPPPPGPAPIELIPAVGNVLSQTGSQPDGPFGLPDLSAYGPTMLLGQNPEPAAPGAPAGPPVIPNFSAFNPDYLLTQNRAPAAPGDGTAAPGFGPDPGNPGSGRIDFLRRLYEMYQTGALRGALLGQQSPEQSPGQFGGESVAPPLPAG